MKPPAHVKVIFSGEFGAATTPYEEWSFGLSTTPGSTAGADEGNVIQGFGTVADQIVPAYTAFSAFMGLNARCTRIRLVCVGDDGKYRRGASGAYVLHDEVVNIPGSGAVRYPPQIALAVTLESDFPGPTGRGRFFIPSPAVGLNDATARMTDADTLAMQAAADTFLSDVNAATWAGYSGNIVVASGGSVLRGLPPQLHPALRVRVGSALDTLRTRRKSLPEAYPTPALFG